MENEIQFTRMRYLKQKTKAKIKCVCVCFKIYH